MIPRSELPKNAADWTDIEISFPRLADDTADSCPVSLHEIMNHVRMESADVGGADPGRLVFIRTAKVGKASFWLWSYHESDGQKCYVVLQTVSDGSNVLGLSEPNGLSPEQYLLADYYDEVYWS